MSNEAVKSTGQANRLLSLDVFRGATIASMILVNNPGSWKYVYSQLDHAPWNGWTFTDVIFPFFLFIVGVAMALSTAKAAQTQGKKQLYARIIRRAIILFALGLFLNGFPRYDFFTIRIMGVLQRIALCYFFASIIHLELDIPWQIVVSVLLLFIYWALMAWCPVPEVGAGVLEPGRNFSAYVDQLVLRSHVWGNTKTWDPEGIISTIPAISTTLFGVFAGMWISREGDKIRMVKRLLLMGCYGLIVGSVWDLFLPINKSLWTSSYAVFMSGLAAVALGVLYYVVEIRRSQWWIKPFVVYGANAITVFVLAGLLARILLLVRMPAGHGRSMSLTSYLYSHCFASWLGPMNGSVGFAVAFIAALYLPMWVLYRKKIFIKV